MVSDVARVDSLALAEDVLARAMNAGASEAEVLVMADDLALTRFANNEIHQNVAETNVSVSLRFVLGKRIATAASGRIDQASLAALVERAGDSARTVEELEDWAGLPAPDPSDGSGGLAAAYAESTAEASPELRAEGARAVIGAAEARGIVAYGSFTTSREEIAVANSSGIRSHERRTSSQLLTVTMSPGGGTGYAERAATDVMNIDPESIGREAAERARAADHAISVPAGDYPVVLEPYAVVDILDMLGYVGFSGLAVEEGRSFSEPGRRVGSDLVTIIDDGANTSGLPMTFDYEGVRKQRVVLIENGVCRDVVYDAQTAARAGRSSTGHGLPAPNPYGPFPMNMMMAHGSTPHADLVAGIDRGLLVTRFHYTNPVHPKLAIITGMTRDGTFLIEHGEVVAPVRNLRFTQSYLDALAAVSAVGRDLRTLRGSSGAVVVPALRIDTWTFTGTTEH
jgi:PmbA protein